MTKKRVLFLIETKEDLKSLVHYSKLLKANMNDANMVAIYVKDILKYEIIPTAVNTMGIQNSSTIMVDEYKSLEENLYEEIKKEAVNYFDKVYSVEGETVDVLLDEMKAFDLLVVFKKETFSSKLSEILKNRYKPIILIPPKETYSLDNVIMLNDGAYRVNKSLFAYFNLFGEKNIDVLRVNVEEKNRLTERFGDILNIIDKSGEDTAKIILDNIKNHNLIIMGELKYSAILERLTGQIGIKIIENIQNPIFIG